MTADMQVIVGLGMQRDAASAPSNREFVTAVDKCGTMTRGQSGDDSIPSHMRLTRDPDSVGDGKRVAKRPPQGRRSRGTLAPFERSTAWPTAPDGPYHARACGITTAWWLSRDVPQEGVCHDDARDVGGLVAHLTHTSDKATWSTTSRALRCLCAEAGHRRRRCPACVLNAYLRGLDVDARNAGSPQHPGDATLFRTPSGDRPTLMAMYDWVDEVATANRVPRLGDEGRVLGRHVRRRTMARWHNRVVPRPQLASLGNRSSNTLTSPLEWGAAAVPPQVARALAGESESAEGSPEAPPWRRKSARREGALPQARRQRCAQPVAGGGSSGSDGSGTNKEEYADRGAGRMARPRRKPTRSAPRRARTTRSPMWVTSAEGGPDHEGPAHYGNKLDRLMGDVIARAGRARRRPTSRTTRLGGG